MCRYISSRIFWANPPGDDSASKLHKSAPEGHQNKEKRLQNAEPSANTWVCIVLLVATIAIMAVTAEFVRLESLKQSPFVV